MREKRLLEFVSLIRKYTRSSIKVAIDYRSFNRVLKSQQTIRKNSWFLKHPYETALTRIIAGVLSSVEFEPSRERIEFIFDHGLAFQAADLFAWHVRKEHHELALEKKYESPIWCALSEIPKPDFSIDEKELRGLRNRTSARLLGRS